QQRFESLFEELEPGGGRALEAYFNEVSIPYVPRFAYGDAIASAQAGTSPLARAYRTFAQRLLETSKPWESFEPGGHLSQIEIGGRALSLAEAEDQCLREIGLQIAAKNHVGAARWLEILASIKERLGKIEEAVAHHLEAVAQYRAGRDDAALAGAVCSLARLE